MALCDTPLEQETLDYADLLVALTTPRAKGE